MRLGSADTLALAGMMGSGKSAVASHLARLLRRPLVRLDDEIARMAGRPVSAIFADQGEAAFRDLERRAVATLPAGVVADLGGGAFCDPASAARLLAIGTVVFLDVSPAEAARRIGSGGGRPLAASWEELYPRRRPLYLRAHLRVETDGLSPEAVARRIVGSLQPMTR